MALRVARNSFVLLIASVLVGAYVLDFFALSVDVVRVAGGLVVCSVAWQLLNQQDLPATAAADAGSASAVCTAAAARCWSSIC